ncbi:alpha/beta fold hydrolase [Nocardiopsis sp. LOL_012]|uniref:alpha/beta fold hydrolase n=1 Tax=Nocardiopsis sp. LOL_012 TaxID=3345409 RepID=UPI003A87A173
MRRRTRAAVSAGALLAVFATAAPTTAQDPAPDTEQAAPGLAWGPCADLEAAEGEALECARLEVPLARTADGAPADGSEATVELALSRVPATGASERTLLVNPGGPGSRARHWAVHTARRMPAELRETYDVVAFDPRGIGASTPGIVCDPGHLAPVRPDTVPADASAEAALREAAAAYAHACGENTGALLDHMRTEDTAHDLDAVRAALGRERIDYLGYSYGTYLGTVYSALYPERIRALVLDSAVGPDTPWYESNHRQSRALDRAIGNFFAWTARHDGVYRLGTTERAVTDAYYRLRSELAEAPDEGTVGPTELETAVLVAAYTDAVWPGVARALSSRVNDGDPAALVDLHTRFGDAPDGDRAYGGYLAVQCTDAHWPDDWDTWRGDAAKAHVAAPFMGWHNTWYNAPCMDWPAESGDWFQVGDGPGEHPAYTGPALIVHGTEDGATPVEGAHALRARLPGSVLVTEEGGRVHGITFGGNTCVDETVTAYLRDGRLPERTGRGPDTACAARSAPAPRTGQGAPAARAEPVGPVWLERSDECRQPV